MVGASDTRKDRLTPIDAELCHFTSRDTFRRQAALDAKMGKRSHLVSPTVCYLHKWLQRLGRVHSYDFPILRVNTPLDFPQVLRKTRHTAIPAPNLLQSGQSRWLWHHRQAYPTDDTPRQRWHYSIHGRRLYPKLLRAVPPVDQCLHQGRRLSDIPLKQQDKKTRLNYKVAWGGHEELLYIHKPGSDTDMFICSWYIHFFIVNYNKGIRDISWRCPSPLGHKSGPQNKHNEIMMIICYLHKWLQRLRHEHSCDSPNRCENTPPGCPQVLRRTRHPAISLRFLLQNEL